MYGADGVVLLGARRGQIAKAEALGYGGCPSAWPRPRARCPTTRRGCGRPRGFTLTVSDVEIAAGAGFLVALTGEIITMPGLPRRPNAENVDVAPDGAITGLF